MPDLQDIMANAFASEARGLAIASGVERTAIGAALLVEGAALLLHVEGREALTQRLRDMAELVEASTHHRRRPRLKGTPMSTKVRYVDAVFGGQQVRFQIPATTNDISWGMSHIGSPYATFQRFAAGAWTMAELRGVLGLSFGRGGHLGPPLDVTRTLIENPPGIYAPLAARILEAYPFGIEPHLSLFDERDPFAVHAAPDAQGAA